MRRAIAFLAFSILASGQASAGEWGSWLGGGHGGCSSGHCSHGSAAGYNGDHVLYPQLAPWVLQQSACKQPCTVHNLFNTRHAVEPQFFPPLPYSHKAVGYQPGINAVTPLGPH